MSRLVVLCTTIIFSQILPTQVCHCECPLKIGSDLNWWYQLRSKSYPQKCMQILHSTSDSTDVSVACIVQRLIPFNFSFYVRSVETVVSSAILSNTKSNLMMLKSCPSIFGQKLNELFNENNCKDLNSRCQRFLPHSWILVYSHSDSDYSEMDENQLDYTRDNALHVFIAKRNHLKVVIKEALSGQSLIAGSTNSNAVKSFMETYRVHPLFRNEIFSGKDRRKPFRISFFDCRPYVIVGNGSKSDSEESYDGLEYRFVEEVTRNWNVQQLVSYRDSNFWTEFSINHLSKGLCDMAMCAVWVTKDRADRFELTESFDFNCGTFLVAKSKVLDASNNIFWTMTAGVWIIMAASLVTSAVCLVIFSSSVLSGKDGFHYGHDNSRSIVDLVNIATNHGLTILPKQSSLKWIVMSWIVLCLLVSVGYSTGYTSLMTNPRYTKSVDTLEEFVNNNYTWGYFEYYNDLEKSSVPAYQQLFRQGFKEKDPAEKLRNIRENPFYAVYTEVIFDRFLTAIQTVMDDALNMRLMRSCIDNHWTTFALQKNSPYTEYFNEKIAIVKETGILQHWMQQIQMRHFKKMQRFFDDQSAAAGKTEYEPKALRLDDVKSAFWILLVMLASSIVVFVLEIMHNHRVQMNTNDYSLYSL